ncbi:fibronectin type III domain-containing protein [Patescibacteria group bacterium]
MKNWLKFALPSLIILSFALMLWAAGEVEAKKSLNFGSLIRGKTIPTVYYLGDDNKRYVFPNAKTYHSWFDGFDNVTVIEDEDLYDYPLGGNVRYKPGVILVKIQTDPKVYAVSKNGLLRWIKTEALAKYLYGVGWNLMIDDVPDSFFVNYQIGDPIDEEGDYDPENEEEEAPTISYNLGFKHKKVQARITSQLEKRCRWLNRAISRLQKRLNRWGMNLDSIGDDYVDLCVVGDSDDDDQDDIPGAFGKKVTICHMPGGNLDKAHTITVSKFALPAHLAHGDTIGACGSVEPEPEPEPDEDAPIISDIVLDIQVTSAIITWTTDESSDSAVEFAAKPLSSASTTSTVSDSATTTTHSITLSGLTASTTYYYIIKSKDSSDNLATTTESSFTTLPEPEPEPVPDTDAPVISGIGVVATSTSATIGWATDEESKSKVVYADSPLDSASTTTEVTDDTLTTNHSIELTGLISATTYYFYVESEDAVGNVASSTEQSFLAP